MGLLNLLTQFIDILLQSTLSVQAVLQNAYTHPQTKKPNTTVKTTFDNITTYYHCLAYVSLLLSPFIVYSLSILDQLTQ